MDPLLSNHVRIFNQLKDKLKDEFELEDDDEALLGTIEGESGLIEYLIAMLRRARERKAFGKACGEMARDMAKRQSSLELGAEKLEALVEWAMSETGQKKIVAPDFTASLAKSRAPLLITDDTAAATQVPRVQKPEVDRTKLRLALEHGETYWFATLGNPGTHLTIRTR